MEALGINLGLIIVQILAFAIVMVTLNVWVFKPMTGMLNKRRETIAKGIEDARVAAEARANAEKDATKIMAEAEKKASHTVAEARERAEAAAREVKVSADADAAKARDAALAEVEGERNKILGDLRGQVAALAIAAANKLVGEALDEKKQRALLDEFFSGVKSGKVVVVGENLTGDAAVVTSALPLSNDEQAAVKQSVSAKDYSFKVDPSILGGLVIKVDEKVLDASVAGKLEGLRSALK